jgi:hypothetical protein
MEVHCIASVSLKQAVSARFEVMVRLLAKAAGQLSLRATEGVI